MFLFFHLAGNVVDQKSSEKPKKRVGKKNDVSIDGPDALPNSGDFIPMNSQICMLNMQSLMSYNPMDMHGVHRLDILHHRDVNSNYIDMKAKSIASSSSSSSSKMMNPTLMNRNIIKTDPASIVKMEKGDTMNNYGSASKFSKTPVSTSQYNLRNHSVHTADSANDYLNQSLDSMDSGELDLYRYIYTFIHTIHVFNLSPSPLAIETALPRRQRAT